MAEITVERTGDAYSVRVVEGSTESVHDVTVSGADLARLGSTYETPESFIRACFEFLLEREPKEQILSRFDVSVISRYFPEFEDRIRR